MRRRLSASARASYWKKFLLHPKSERPMTRLNTHKQRRLGMETHVGRSTRSPAGFSISQSKRQKTQLLYKHGTPGLIWDHPRQTFLSSSKSQIYAILP